MKRILLSVLLGMLPLVSYARLGETNDQLQQRFGAPTLRGEDKIIAQGKFIDLCPILHFKQDDWRISCHLIEGRSSRESYRKPGEWTEDQLALVLSSNAQGAKWQETTNPALKKVKREWRREDGATAVWQLAQSFTVTHPAYNLAKQRAQSKAKADASRLPNL